MRKLLLLFMMRRRRAGIVLVQRFMEEIGEGVALVLSDDHEAPGEELAMVRRPRRNGEDAVELRLARPGSRHLARAAGAAGFEEGESGAEVVEHRPFI